MSSDATGFGVVNLKGDLWSYLNTLDVEEAAIVSTILAFEIKTCLLDIMSAGMEDRKEQHSVGDLSVEPL